MGDASTALHVVDPTPINLDGLRWILGDQWEHVRRQLADASAAVGDAHVWNINSTAKGGGVAEMLHAILAYSAGMSLRIGWLVIQGDAPFFEITKRIHNYLHGVPGDGGPLAEHERAAYERALRDPLDAIRTRVRPGDWVICHDPQTAGLIHELKRLGARVIWRCHIGNDTQNEHTRLGWAFLDPYVRHADASVFSRESYIPECLHDHRCVVVRPSIDPLSPKNQALHTHTCRRILYRTGILARTANGSAPDDFEAPLAREVERVSRVVREGGPLDADRPLVLQVSRWDALKDPLGVMRAHVEHMADSPAVLILAGPDPIGVSDDPEGRQVYEDVLEAWKALPEASRRRVQLACLPMDDLRENALIVNALQRHATVVVQKSLREGFGLTVSEAMWKARPVVASAVGGIQDQIEHGSSGFLVHPEDLEGFADAIARLVEDPLATEHVGFSGRERVAREFLMTRTMLDYARLILGLDDA